MENSSQKKKIIYLVLGIFFVAVIATLIFLVRQSQESRSRAAGEAASFAFSPATQNISSNQELSIDITLNSPTTAITGVDITLNIDPNTASFIRFEPSTSLNTQLIAKHDAAANTYRFAAVDTSSNSITGNIQLGTLVLKAKTNGTGAVTITKSQVTASGLSTALATNNSATAQYTISGTTSNTATPPPITTIPPPMTPVPTTSDPQGPNDIVIVFTLMLHGIGNIGDSAAPDKFQFSNKNPLHPQRPLAVEVLNASNAVVNKSGYVLFNPTSGSFKGTVNIGSIPSGTYIIKVKTPQFLKKQTSLLTLQPGQTVNLPTLALVAGDINNDNILNTLDYNSLLSCYGSSSGICTDPITASSDLTNDGKVDDVDLNRLFREFSVQNGD